MVGPVSAGSPYVVGEAGPEIFVPSAQGRCCRTAWLRILGRRWSRRCIGCLWLSLKMPSRIRSTATALDVHALKGYA